VSKNKNRKRRELQARREREARLARQHERELRRQAAAEPKPEPKHSWSAEALRVLGLLLKDPLLQLVAGTVLAAAVGITQAIAGHLSALAFLLAAQRVGGSYALLAAFFQVVNSLWRIRLHHWTTAWRLGRKLILEVFVGAFIPLAIAALAFGFGRSVLTALALPLVYFIFSLVYEPIETSIYHEVESLGLDHGTEALANVRGLGKRVAERRTPTIRLIAWLLTRDAGEISRIRRVIIAGTMVFLVVSFCGAISALAAGGKLPFVPARSHLLQSQEQKSVRAKGPSAKKTATNHVDLHPNHDTGATNQGQTPAPETQDAPLGTWDDYCVTQPGYDAPKWARIDLSALYLGGLELHTDPPPGALQGGCTGRTSVVRSDGETLYYVTGTSISGDQTLSVAVVSARFGPAIFLSPATGPVLELLRRTPRGDVLGGESRQDVANGDIYLIHDSRGTTLLIRRTKTISTDSTLAEPYVELFPSVAQAFLEAIQSRAGSLGVEERTLAWLWPVAATLPDGTIRYQLLDPVTNEPVATVDYDPRSGTAQRTVSDRTLTYAETNSNFTIADIKSYMPPPPPPAPPPPRDGVAQH